MIITRLIGGLGNQLFQYAAGRALALANDCKLKLDISEFRNYTLRSFELMRLNINAELADPRDVSLLVGSKAWVAKTVRRKFKWRRNTHFVERKDYSFDSAFFKLTQPVYLEGFWQSYKYFESYALPLRREFTFNTLLAGKNAELADFISRTNSISMHIRRGDYVSKPENAKVLGSVGIDYYNQAIHKVRDQIVKPVIFAFSDDLSWVKDNIESGENTVFVSHNSGMSSFEDMRLMSLCKHNIIANSSFSWWGAWLNTNPEKMVIAPKRWLKNNSYSTEDLIPNTWIRI
jgi:hypothetical protein